MPENWNTYNLEDLGTIVTGKTPSSKHPEHFGNYLPFVTPTDFSDYHKNVSFASRYLSTEGAKHFKTKILPLNSVLVTCIGSQMGKVVVNKSEVLTNQQLNSIIPNKKANSDFLYYKLSSIHEKLRSMAGAGSTMPMLNKSDFGKIEIKVPELVEQKSIASILSALDDKIELNLQMNKTLEEMAMALYKHWFVDFGPFQDGEFVDSKLGKIPKGWEVLSLSDVTSKITDGAHHSPKSVEQGKPMASVKDMDHWGFNIETCRKISEEDYSKLTNQGCRPLKNDVVIAKDGSYLKHAFVIEKDLDIVLLSSIAILKPNEKLNPHLLNLNLKLDSVKTRMKAIVSGAAIQRIVLKEFRKFLIIVPPKHIQNSALQSIEGLMEKCWNNNSQTTVLTDLRNTLLPKLISGEVRVKDVEKTLSKVL